jgi:two-component system chemotaxis response regulator CheB
LYADPVRLRQVADNLLSNAIKLIAVVLTGNGNDAATGTSAVHRFGGTVIACSVESSTRAAMPLATMGRDHVVALDDIPALLIELTTAPLLDPSAPRPS